jgi:CRP-like cAMP-binding protein
MKAGELGRSYSDGTLIVREGDSGDCMYVVQEGEVEVFVVRDGEEIQLAIRREGEFFGEMSIFERAPRSASVRARGDTRVLTVDRKNLLRRVHEDPSLAYGIIEAMSVRIRELSEELANVKRQRAGE